MRQPKPLRPPRATASEFPSLLPATPDKGSRAIGTGPERSGSCARCPKPAGWQTGPRCSGRRSAPCAYPFCVALSLNAQRARRSARLSINPQDGLPPNHWLRTRARPRHCRAHFVFLRGSPGQCRSADCQFALPPIARPQTLRTTGNPWPWPADRQSAIRQEKPAQRQEYQAATN